MPLFNHRVVVVTPAGRQRYLELLVPQVLNYMDAGLVDEYQLWVNTVNASDIAYMQALEKEHKGRIILRYLPEGAAYKENLSIHHFFNGCDEDKTVYVRFDDDVIFLDSKQAFAKLIRFRIYNPRYFLVYGTILNNAIISHIIQRHGDFDLKEDKAGYGCMDSIGWGNGKFACNLHDQILSYLEGQTNIEKNLAKFRMKEWILYNYERVSINCISWVGGALARWADNGRDIADDEEHNLSCKIPSNTGAMNVIFGGFACVHFAFYTQRSAVDGSPNNYLERYKKVIAEKLQNGASPDTIERCALQQKRSNMHETLFSAFSRAKASASIV